MNEINLEKRYLYRMQENWFKDWFNTPYYHQLYKDRNYDEAAKFIHSLVQKLSPSPNSMMLDVACGKGRHSLQLANKGFDVTGIDLSRESIQEALKSETANLHFFEHDMRLPFWMNYFDYAFNFFTSFGYFKTNREDENAIRSIAQSLKKGGIFTIDYLNVSYVEQHMEHVTHKSIEKIDYTITKWHDENHFYKKIIIEDNALGEHYAYTETVRKYSLADFNRMFNMHGLQIQETFGDYQLSKYKPDESQRLIIIAAKK